MVSVFPWTPTSPLIAGGVLVGSLIFLGLLVYGYVKGRRLLERAEERALATPGFLSAKTLDHLATGLFGVALGVATYGLLYAATWVYEPVKGIIFDRAISVLPSILGLGAILLGTAIALEAIRQLARFLRGELPRKPKKKLSGQIVNVLHLFLRYLLYIVAGVGFVITALGVLGFQDVIVASIVGWFTGQAGSLLLLIILVGIGWAGGRIIKALATDLKYTTKRVSPEIVETLGGAARAGLYAFLGIIAIFTLLSAVGLGEIGGTMVLVLSTFIGLIVAMAATGSIGNALAGVVLMLFKPLSKGDRVILLGDLVGDVEEIAIMTTRIRTVPGELVEVPNNIVLLQRIRNLSRSGRHAIVVKLGIGYDVSHNLVRKLAIEAATGSTKILSDPAPKVYATNFGNYAIDYELHAYTDEPRHIAIRSELLGRLQEKFYGAGVEIMTPDIYVIRKGKSAEPEGHVIVQMDPNPPPGKPPNASG